MKREVTRGQIINERFNGLCLGSLGSGLFILTCVAADDGDAWPAIGFFVGFLLCFAAFIWMGTDPKKNQI